MPSTQQKLLRAEPGLGEANDLPHGQALGDGDLMERVGKTGDPGEQVQGESGVVIMYSPSARHDPAGVRRPHRQRQGVTNALARKSRAISRNVRPRP
jgi:hypothetical protein